MGGKGTRARRQEKRAAKFERGLVTKEDLNHIIGLPLRDAQVYAFYKNLYCNIKSIDGKKNENELYAGPYVINVDVVDGKIAKAKTSTRRLNNE